MSHIGPGAGDIKYDNADDVGDNEGVDDDADNYAADGDYVGYDCHAASQPYMTEDDAADAAGGNQS